MTPLTAELQDAPIMNGTHEEQPVDRSNGNGPAPSHDVAKAIAERELKAIVEAMLFVSTEPISVTRLVSALGDVTKAEVERVLRSLADDLEQEGRGVRLAEIAGGYRLVTKQEYATWIKRLDKSKSTTKLSRSALESLAIIAYKQPIVRSEIEEIRGVETSGVVRTLLERKLVRIVGRKEVPGRPIMYGTTKYFLEHFGLSDLSQLPPLREFKELGESEQALLPMDEESGAPPSTEGPAAEHQVEAPPSEIVTEAAADSPPAVSADLSMDLDECSLETGEEGKADEALLGEPVEQN